MKVAYLTIEDITSGLFKTQILDIIEEILNHDNAIKFQIFIINRPWLYFKHKKVLNEYRAISNTYNISFCYIPFLPPLRNALKYYVYSYLVTRWLSFIFNIFINKNEFDLIHARSYWATFSVSNSKIPIIFDLRSLWLLENISTGEIKLNSKSYDYWKQIEIDCIKKSAASTCVSIGMVEYVNNIIPNSKTYLIPISVNEKYFNFNQKNRIKNRDILDWNENVIFIYSGSLGQSGINIKSITELFKKIISLSDNYKILIITSEKSNYVNKIMSTIGIEILNYKIINPKLNEIASWLDCADIGLHALPIQLDSNTRLGTKVVEYWINGLPVIVNKNVGAAAEYIDKYKIGYVIEEDSKDINIKINELLNYDRSYISNFAKNIFSAKHISFQYLQLYQDILNNK
jgi:glycosyltransferase involved in cell wall biosynthesis